MKTIVKGVEIDEKNIYVNGTPVLKGRDVPYEDIILQKGRYIMIGVHGCNPSCYKYLDEICVISLPDLKAKVLKVFHMLGNDHYDEKSKLRGIWLEDGEFHAKSDLHEIIINPDMIFAPNIPKGYKAEVGDGKDLCPSELKKCFTFEVLEDYGILIKLREGIPREHLLKFHGFGMTYNAFKIWDLGKGTSHMMFIDTDKPNGNCLTVSWGHSTSCVSDAIWQQRDELLKCVKELMPNHPDYRNEFYIKRIS